MFDYYIIALFNTDIVLVIAYNKWMERKAKIDLPSLKYAL